MATDASSALSAAAAAPAKAPEPPIEDFSIAKPMTKGTRLLFGIYMMALNVLLVYLLIKIWPEKSTQTAAETVALFWNQFHISVTLEIRYLLIVVLAGGLGSYVHAATSFADFVGNRRCYASWAWWYVLRPFIGIALALMVYFAVRGGLIGASTGADALSPYGIGAVAGLAGMFSKQATDKLREVFETLFKTDNPPDRSDKLTG
ncbi:MAG TPA: hypothetical protein VJA94_06480 [Candidatus Angelobacter sp.]